MFTKLNLVAILLWLPYLSYAQSPVLYQNFDGYDSLFSALFTTIDTSYVDNIWQVGPPQKSIFNNAWNTPNVLITDTIQSYPINNHSSFSMHIPNTTPGWSWSILAIQWMQKLDFEEGKDGGIIEYSIDSGQTWINAFNSPYTYNFYGFDTSNKDTLGNGTYAFSGTDSLWKSIWLCFDYNFIQTISGDFHIRFSIHSDSVDSQQEGWMLDGFVVQRTLVHTVKELEDEPQPYLKVYPTQTQGRVHIEAEKLQEFHIIEQIDLMSTNGQIVQSWGTSPTKFYIDIDNHSNGMYFLRVKTNKKTETIPIILNQ